LWRYGQFYLIIFGIENNNNYHNFGIDKIKIFNMKKINNIKAD